MTTSPLIFLSHITEEEKLAGIVHRLIEEAFPNVTVFRSSDNGVTLPAGSRRIDNITRGLQSCAAMIVICSKQSIYRPWVNFESGAAWVRDIPVTPVCHSNLRREDLPMPLSLLTAANANSADDLNIMLASIAGVINSRIPRTDVAPFVEEIIDFERSYSFTSIIDKSFKELTQLIEQRDGQNVVNQSHTNKIYDISKALMELDVCSIALVGVIITPEGSYHGVRFNKLRNFDIPEVQRYFNSNSS